MNGKKESAPQLRVMQRNQQGEGLRDKEAELRELASRGKKEEFFNAIASRLGPLKDYIRRRLRVAYLEQQLRTPVYTTGDILDWVFLRAYEHFNRKPKDLTLEEWLYRITHEILDEYLTKQGRLDKGRRSLEDLNKKELRTLEEVEKMTADVEGEPYLVEDLDDSEYQRPNLNPPVDEDNPEQELEREEEITGILQALSRIPTQDRIVFDLFAMEGFSKEAVARIANVPAEEVPRIAQRVRAQVLREIGLRQPGKDASTKRAS
jgi:RNA polymerase sigma factor (sigma-70 family)